MLPLLQLNNPMPPGLDIPMLGGAHGLAGDRAALTGRTVPEAQQQASELAAILGAGRLVFGPPGMQADTVGCLEAALAGVIHQQEFVDAASRAGLQINYQDGATAYQGLLEGRRGVKQFHGLIQAAIRQTRE
jgi:hypothetical protein